jgi:lipopolysaccharide/colanic/teichoic acid biosynthesis glycosyltransferase
LTESPQRTFYAFPVKRLLDVVIASAGLLFLWPLFLIIAFAVRSKMGKPVLFRQVRAGLRGKPFTIYKFRTMLVAERAQDRNSPDSERFTPFGRLLRSMSLDELPQLYNVLKGDMSIIGPRPLVMEFTERYTPEQARRLDVRPGMTGWAQINGRNSLSWEEKFEHDVWYVDNCSFWVDLKILFITVVKILKREGITAEKHATIT